MKEKITAFAIKYKTPLLIAGAIILIWAIWYFSRSSSSATSDGSNKSLAKCLKDKGAKFYGASWCPHCNSQKAAFGSDAPNLPYIECSDSSHQQNKQCNDAKVTGYPTWVFADGSRLSGEVPLATLKTKAGC